MVKANVDVSVVTLSNAFENAPVGKNKEYDPGVNVVVSVSSVLLLLELFSNVGKMCVFTLLSNISISDIGESPVIM